MDTLIGQQYWCHYTGEIAEVVAETLTRVQLRYPNGGTENTSKEALDIHWDEVSRPRMTMARAARITHDARNATAPHLTFAEQVDAGHPDPMPCACWYAGNGNIRGLRRDAVTHPAAFAEGAECAYERAYDI